MSKALTASWQDVWLLDGVRTPFVDYNGSLAAISPIDLGIKAAREVFARSGASPQDVGTVITGNMAQASFDAYLTPRHIGLYSGVPIETPAHMVQRVCGTGIEVLMQAADTITHRQVDLALCVGKFSRTAARRIARAAFELAQLRRRHVTIVHKSNVIPVCFGLFLEECRAVAREHPDVEVDDFLLDAMAAHLVRRPQAFDVIVTENLFGDTLSDLASELTGSLGMAASINAGEKYAMAQAAHGSAPDIAGQGIANPLGMVMSVAMLLQHFGLTDEAARIETAVAADLAERVGKPARSTREVGDALAARVAG